MANCLKTALVANILSGCTLPVNGVAELYLISRDNIAAYTTVAEGSLLKDITIPGTDPKVSRVDGFGNSIKATETIKTTDYVTGVTQSVTFPIQGNSLFQQQQALLNGHFVAFTRNEGLKYNVYGLLNGLEVSSFEASTDTNGNASTVTLSTPENSGVEMPISVDPAVWATLTARLFT